MKKYFSILGLILAIFSFCCSTGDQQSVVSSAKKNEVVYVLFDYSKSLDTNSIKTTAKRAFDLVKACPEGTTINFLPINNDPFAQPILQYTQSKMPSKPQEVPLWKKRNGEKAAEIFNKIKDMHQSGNINSCIVHGFSTVYNHVKTLPANSNLRLIVLSDMLECCDNMTCAQDVKGFQKLLTTMSKYNLTACPLSQYIPYEKITLVISASDLPKIKAIYNSPKQEFYQFWELVAKGMGYEKGFVMSPNLPALTN